MMARCCLRFGKGDATRILPLLGDDPQSVRSNLNGVAISGSLHWQAAHQQRWPWKSAAAAAWLAGQSWDVVISQAATQFAYIGGDGKDGASTWVIDAGDRAG